MKGRLITLEGIDCAGKSTNIQVLVDALTLHGYDVVTTREPGGTASGEEIRNILLQCNNHLSAKAELLLFAAARANHLETFINPSIANGKIVVCDRFSDSSYAYQGAGRRLKREVLELEKFVQHEFEPDYTLFFDIPFSLSIERLAKRTGKQDRLDNETMEFKKAVFDGYQERYRQKFYRMHLINASTKPQTVARSVTQWVENIFIPNNPLT